MSEYNLKDIFLQRRTSTGTFEEHPLVVHPNSLIVTDNANNLEMIDTSSFLAGTGSITYAVSSSVSVSSSFALSSSYAGNVPNTASYSLYALSSSNASTASIALNVPNTASYAISSDSASYLKTGANIYLSQSYILANISSDTSPYQEGAMYWDKRNHTYTINTDKYSSSIQIGQENLLRVEAGENIPKAKAVYIFDSNTSGIPIVMLAIADGTGTKNSVVGLSTQELITGEEGFITTQGIIEDVSIPLIWDWFDGDTLYLSNTESGSLVVVTPPAYPAESVFVGTVIYSHPTVGKLLVSSPLDITISTHNNLNILQGGTGSQYYHLTANEYTGSGTGIFVRQINSKLTASLQGTSSWSDNSITSSYLKPGATFYVISGSDGIPPAYIEPYDYSIGNYLPPFKEGRLWYDGKYNDWTSWEFNDTGSSTFRMHLGKEVTIGVRNPNNVILPRMTAVYISGSTETTDYQPSVYPAIADGSGRANILGVIRSNIGSGSKGFCLMNGVMHRTDMTQFGSVNIGDKLWLSPTVAGGLTTDMPGQPYDQVLVGYVSELGVIGSFICSITINPPPSNAYAGMTSHPTITSNGSGSITVSTGSVNLYSDSTGYGLVTSYPLLEKTFSLETGSTNYITVHHTGSNVAEYYLTTNASYANGINIVRVATLDINYRGVNDWDIHEFDIGVVGLALANRINNKDILLYGYQRQNGLTLYTTDSSGSFGITEGIVWYGPNYHTVPAYLSSTGETYLFSNTSSNGTSSWNQITTSVFINGYYDSGSLGLSPLTSGSWTVNYVYRLIGTTDEAAIVLSSQEFSTELEASNNAQTPSNLPSTIRDIGMLVGRFVVQSGSFAPTVESAYSNIFMPSVVTDHEGLIGLEGGGSGGGHYHIGLNDWNGNGTGLMVRQTNPTMSNPYFTAATPYHIPYWSSNKTLTLTGSVQVQDGQYVVINSASVDLINPEALLVKQLNPNSVNLIGGYGDINNFLQLNIQNQNTGSEALSALVTTADDGTLLTNYLALAIGSSTYSSSFLPIVTPHDSVVLCEGGNLVIGTQNNGKVIKFFVETASIENVKGIVNASGFLITGSLYGTSSLANNAISSSHTLTASIANAISFVPLTAISASWISASIKITTADTASHVLASNIDGTINSSSYALSASFALNATPTISSSWASSSLSSSYADIAITASFVTLSQTASYVVMAETASFVSTSSFAITASFASNVVNNPSASWSSQSLSSSFATIAHTASFVATASYVDVAETASFVTTAQTASFVTTAQTASFVATAQTASFVVTAQTASFVATASFVTLAQTASYVLEALSASYVSASHSQIDDLLSTTITVNQGAKISGMSMGVASTNTVQIATIADGFPTSTNNTDGAVQIGNTAGQNSTTASNAVQIGSGAGGNATTASSAVQIGSFAGSNSTNAESAVQIGPGAGYNSTNAAGAIQIGQTAGGGSTEAAYAVQIGYAAGGSVIATSAVQIGGWVGSNSVTASNAVQIGESAGSAATNATDAVQVGKRAGFKATNSEKVVQVGNEAGYYAKTGSYTTFVGSYADTVDEGLNVEKSIAIGYNAKVSASNTCVIGGIGVDAVKVAIGKTSAVNTLDIIGNISCSIITASLQGTASYSLAGLSASYSATTSVYLYYNVTQSMTYITSASYASASSMAYTSNTSTQSVYATSASWVSSSVKITTADTASYVLVSSIDGIVEQSLYATNSISATSASWVSASVTITSASYSLTASYSLNGGGTGTGNVTQSLFATNSIYAASASWISASAKITTADTASYISSSAIFDVGKVYVHTASYSTNAGNAYAINFVPLTSTSASWISASVTITTADTASYISSSAIFDVGKVYVHTASYSTNAGNAYAINFVPSTSTSSSWVSASVKITTANTASYISSSATFDVGKVYVHTASYATNATTAISASWASSSVSSSFTTTASYVLTTFSRGGTFYDALGIAGTAASSQNVIIWRSPFNCTITNLWGYRVTGSGATVNARINGVGTIATGSHISLTSADTWMSASSLITSSIATGDKLEIMLVSSSAYPTSVGIQIDLTR